MRSKIEANEYKDYILGFIFYKFLSDKEVKYLKGLGYTDADLDTVTEDDEEIVKNVQQNIGYFISYENLFSTWLKLKSDFNVSNVRDALSAFSRLINPSHKKVFDKVFDTLQTGLSKLGDSSNTQTKSISDLLHLIKDIPMDYDGLIGVPITFMGCYNPAQFVLMGLDEELTNNRDRCTINGQQRLYARIFIRKKSASVVANDNDNLTVFAA